MDIVLGATGQIGSMLARGLFNKGRPVRAVVRNESKAQDLVKKGIEVFVADYLDREELMKAFHGGRTAFLLTPEDPRSNNHIDEVRRMLSNYREAVLASNIGRVVGLSSMGAQHGPGAGSLYASYLLEHTFSGLELEQVFVRPAYYYSNWVGYLELIKSQGKLPTFFPPDMELPMVSPVDVAGFLADVMTRETFQERIYEVCGPRDYSSSDIARIFGDVLNKDVTLQQILPDEWETALAQAGFTADGAKDLMLMMKTVIDDKTKISTPDPIRLPTDFRMYLEKQRHISDP